MVRFSPSGSGSLSAAAARATVMSVWARAANFQGMAVQKRTLQMKRATEKT